MDAEGRWPHNRALGAFAERLARLQVPTIAALNGLTFGGGLEITSPATFASPPRMRGSRFPKWASA